ncbi:hypothetical protein NKG05_04025 [Oerskovia sp. M15]
MTAEVTGERDDAGRSSGPRPWPSRRRTTARASRASSTTSTVQAGPRTRLRSSSPGRASTRSRSVRPTRRATCPTTGSRRSSSSRTVAARTRPPRRGGRGQRRAGRIGRVHRVRGRDAHRERRGSGVASVEHDLDGAGWAPYTGPVVVTGPGEHTLAYRATDEAGNVSEVASVTLTVVVAQPGDTVAPVVSASVYGARNSAGEYVGRALVRLAATDDDSGVATIEYQVDGGTWYRYASQVAVSTPGQHTVAFRATDVAGNTSAPKSLTLVVASTVPADTVAPK